MKLLAGLLIAVLACASGGTVASHLAETASLLTVDNAYQNDMRVWVVHDGARERSLGVVTSYSKSVFVLRSADMIDGTLQLLAISYLDNVTLLSDRITLAPGQSAEFDLRPSRGQQFLWPKSSDGEVALDSARVCRAPSCRSSTVAHRFMRLTGHPTGWPGHIVDHMHPLECGGVDAVENLQWQTAAEARAKDLIETQCARWLPSARSDGKPVPNAPIP